MYYEPQVFNHAQARPHDDHHLPSCIQHLLQGSVFVRLQAVPRAALDLC